MPPVGAADAKREGSLGGPKRGVWSSEKGELTNFLSYVNTGKAIQSGRPSNREGDRIGKAIQSGGRGSVRAELKLGRSLALPFCKPRLAEEPGLVPNGTYFSHCNPPFGRVEPKRGEGAGEKAFQ